MAFLKEENCKVISNRQAPSKKTETWKLHRDDTTGITKAVFWSALHKAVFRSARRAVVVHLQVDGSLPPFLQRSDEEFVYPR